MLYSVVTTLPSNLTNSRNLKTCFMVSTGLWSRLSRGSTGNFCAYVTETTYDEITKYCSLLGWTLYYEFTACTLNEIIQESFS